MELDKDVTIAVDSTGIKVSNRGEWIRKVWKVKRGFIKVHIAVDTKTKQILAIEVTREDVGDGRMLGRLVEGSVGKANVKRVIGDGTYDSKNNFRMLAQMSIDPLIRVWKNASLKGAGVCHVSLRLWSSWAIQSGDARGVMVLVGWLSRRFQA